jgi:hypothetical protein
MYAIHASKDHDYAGEVPFANFRRAEMIGIPAWKGALVRMSDKWSRIENLALKDDAQVKDESFDDTLIDIANYAIIVYILRSERPLSVETFESKRSTELGYKERNIGDTRGADGKGI